MKMLMQASLMVVGTFEVDTEAKTLVPAGTIPVRIFPSLSSFAPADGKPMAPAEEVNSIGQAAFVAVLNEALKKMTAEAEKSGVSHVEEVDMTPPTGVVN